MKVFIGFILILISCPDASSQKDFSAFIQLRDNDPLVAKYSYDQMRKALDNEKYATDFEPCAANIEKYFRLRAFKEVLEKPGHKDFWSYMRAFEDRGSAGLHEYAGELNPFPNYNAGQYMAGEDDNAKYKKSGIDLRDASANSFPSIFNWYRDYRLSTGSMGSYVMENMKEKDFNAVKSSLQKKWGAKLGPQADYRQVVEDYYEAQLMIHIEKKLTAIFPTVYKPLLASIPACRQIFLEALKETVDKEKTGALISSGTYSDNYSTVIVNYNGGYISVSFTYKVDLSEGSGSWDCKVEGNKISGTWIAQHEDDTKTGKRNGTVTATFDGTSMTGEYVEGTPEWSYKPGYSASNVFSKMVKGKVWPFTFNKK